MQCLGVLPGRNLGCTVSLHSLALPNTALNLFFDFEGIYIKNGEPWGYCRLGSYYRDKVEQKKKAYIMGWVFILRRRVASMGHTCSAHWLLPLELTSSFKSYEILMRFITI